MGTPRAWSSVPMAPSRITIPPAASFSSSQGGPQGRGVELGDCMPALSSFATRLPRATNRLAAP
jgi:hypothetical protein